MQAHKEEPERHRTSKALWSQYNGPFHRCCPERGGRSQGNHLHEPEVRRYVPPHSAAHGP